MGKTRLMSKLLLWNCLWTCKYWWYFTKILWFDYCILIKATLSVWLTLFVS